MNLKKHFSWQFFLLVVIVIGFIIFELPYINRPLYWDEAWSYGSAVKALFDKGPSLLPGAINEYLYRGHPMFFYFITSVWMKIFGTSPAVIHLFFLILSVLVIFAVFFISKKIQNENTGLIASVCLLITPIYLAQASFMLPEVMLALFSLLTFYYYIEKKLIPEIIFGSLLLLTKESGIVLIGTILLFDFIIKIIDSGSFQSFFKKVPDLLKHTIPILIASLFFILQKIELGWFFYPGHVDLMDFNPETFWNKTELIFRYTFRQQGRQLLSLIFVFSLIWVIIAKKQTSKEVKTLTFSGLFILNYIIFSALNFFTIRYIISIFPFFFIVFAVVLNKTFNKVYYLSFIPVFIFSWISITESIHSDSIGDVSPKFLKVVEVHEKAVECCESANYYDKKIGTHFLMLYYLQNPFMGYLKGIKKFSDVDIYNGKDKDILILSSIEQNQAGKSVRADTLNYKLLKRFENDMAWCEIYEKKDVPQKEHPKTDNKR